METFEALTRVTHYEKKGAIGFNGKTDTDPKLRIFSNYYPFDFTVDGVTFHSVEQYYHYRRCSDPKDRKKLLTYTGEDNAHQCRHYAHIRSVSPRVEQDPIKRIEYMREGLKYKLQFCEGFQEALQATINRPLVEYAPWGDVFWGAKGEGKGGKGAILKGANVLGKLLMELRDRAVKKTAEKTPISTPVEPPTVEVAPTIQPTEKKPLKQPKQVEEQKHIYADSLLDRIKGDFIVRYRIEYRVEECRVDSYGEACDLYQQAQDIMTTSNNPCWLALFNGDDIIEIELYD